MLRFPIMNDDEFVVIEPGNIKRLKAGHALKVGKSLVAFTPDMKKFAEMIGVSGDLPDRGQVRQEFVNITPEQIEKALVECLNLPEVER